MYFERILCETREAKGMFHDQADTGGLHHEEDELDVDDARPAWGEDGEIST